MLIFCATQDMVDYLTPLLASVLSEKDTIEESSDEDEEEKEEDQDQFKIRSNVHFFRLHGNMTQKVFFVENSSLCILLKKIVTIKTHLKIVACICFRTELRCSKLFGTRTLEFCCAR